jgi:GlcNAc-PI de-N-acetylase.
MKSKLADFYVYDNESLDKAMNRTTHLAISAHQDDIEFMAYAGIAECFGRQDKWFSAVVVTDGAGSPRSGIYENYTDAEMQKVRQVEQKKAAFIGEYSSLSLLNYPSSAAKDGKNTDVVDDLGR